MYYTMLPYRMRAYNRRVHRYSTFFLNQYDQQKELEIRSDQILQINSKLKIVIKLVQKTDFDHHNAGQRIRMIFSSIYLYTFV